LYQKKPAHFAFLQGFRASGLQGFRASGLQGFRASGLQGFRALPQLYLDYAYNRVNNLIAYNFPILLLFSFWILSGVFRFLFCPTVGKYR